MQKFFITFKVRVSSVSGIRGGQHPAHLEAVFEHQNGSLTVTPNGVAEQLVDGIPNAFGPFQILGSVMNTLRSTSRRTSSVYSLILEVSLVAFPSNWALSCPGNIAVVHPRRWTWR